MTTPLLTTLKTNLIVDEFHTIAAQFIPILDEYGYYAFNGLAHDALREVLREREGIPNAVYQVEGDLVFVFEKLVKLVVEQQPQATELPPAELTALALSLLPNAYVTPAEAVQHWSILPRHYGLLKLPSGEVKIKHNGFGAVIPGEFATEEAAQPVLITLLMGGIQPGSGDFVYQGQAFTWCSPVEMGSLPEQPVLEPVTDLSADTYVTLQGTAYEPGCEPLSEPVFEQLRSRDIEWKQQRAQLMRGCKQQAEWTWIQLSAMDLSPLQRDMDAVPDYGLDDYQELRSLYPELSSLSDATLYYLFDDFQSECYFNNGWSASRDLDFLFFVLGKLANPQLDGDCAKEYGQWVAAALAQGQTRTEALVFAEKAQRYHAAHCALTYHIHQVMSFLRDAKTNAPLQGAPISTWRDTFRMARKFSIPVEMTQQLE